MTFKDNENQIEKLEHDESLHLKKTAAYGWDGTKAVMLKTNSLGEVALDYTNLDSRYVNVTGDTMPNVDTGTDMGRFRFNMPASYTKQNYAVIQTGGEFDGGAGMWFGELGIRVATQICAQAKNDGTNPNAGFAAIIALADSTRDPNELYGFFSAAKGPNSAGGGVELGSTTVPAKEGFVVEGYISEQLLRITNRGATGNAFLVIDPQNASFAGHAFYCSSWQGTGDYFNFPGFRITNTGDIISNGSITSNAFTIGVNTLDTTEWANLDGINQTLATTSSPSFTRLGIGQTADATAGLAITTATTNGTGIVINSLGTATRGIDLSNAGLSGTTDYYLYNNATNFWRADGSIYAYGNIFANNYAIGMGNSGGGYDIWVNTGGNLRLLGRPTDSATAVAIQLAARIALTTAGAKIVDFQNGGGTRMAYIDKDGLLGQKDGSYFGILDFTSTTALTADRILTIDLDNADRTLKMQGNLTIEANSLINQDLTSDANVTFNSVALTNQPRVRLTNSVDWSIPNVTWTNLTFNTETFDTDNMHDTAVNTERITINTAGTYIITGQIAFNSNATGMRGLRIFLNNTTYIALQQLPTTSGTYAIFSVSTGPYQFNAGDYVTLGAYQNSGGALGVAKDYTHFSAIRVA